MDSAPPGGLRARFLFWLPPPAAMLGRLSGTYAHPGADFVLALASSITPKSFMIRNNKDLQCCGFVALVQWEGTRWATKLASTSYSMLPHFSGPTQVPQARCQNPRITSSPSAHSPFATACISPISAPVSTTSSLFHSYTRCSPRPECSSAPPPLSAAVLSTPLLVAWLMLPSSPRDRWVLSVEGMSSYTGSFRSGCLLRVPLRQSAVPMAR